ncbi:MAG: thymidine phosphorylase [Anaerolineaceae bacterium]|nr:thymidine phosphorylase [Anaerolineaceae bacterium]
MRTVDIIQKKRDGQPLTEEEIKYFIETYTHDDLPDYQAAALLMAIFWRGMNRQETVTLTQAMAHSGKMMDLSGVIDYAVDKHSSGGVGDKTTLVVLPLVAAMGVPVAKMSGRGLGFSGGTLDKLESISGYDVNLSDQQFLELAAKNGIVLSGQTGELAPADGKLYALRDVTATVPSMPLIASSIMSKKLASGANGMVLDVKWGNGAFMTTLDDAQQLADIMVKIGADAGRDVIALLSDMNQPLGQAVGNALEVIEAIETLKGGGPADFREHCLEVAHYMVQLAGQGEKWTDADAVRSELEEHLNNGEALEKFRLMVEAQGGDLAQIDDPSKLPSAKLREDVLATESGYIEKVVALQVAYAANALGAGREKKGDPVDHAVGVMVYVNVGDKVAEGDRLFTIHANSEAQLAEAKAHLAEAISYASAPVEPLPLFYGVIDSRVL